MTNSTQAIEKAKAAVNGAPALKHGDTLPDLLNSPSVKRRFEEVLGKKSAGFVSSILTLYNTNTNFAEVNPRTIISSAMIAATLDLPINSNLGFAHIVPYSGVAQFQMGWRGFVQLAIRTGQYKTINAAEVYEGELKNYNRFTGEIEFDQNGKKSDKVIGFYAFFRLVTGFEKSLYMTADEVRNHGQKFSKSFSNPKGRWQQDFNAMGLKTVIKLLLGKWGILSVDLQKAIVVDQGVLKDENLETVEYPDAKEPVDEIQKEMPAARKVTALDVAIHTKKKEIGDKDYYEILGGMGYEHMNDMPELEKEVFLHKLQEHSRKKK